MYFVGKNIKIRSDYSHLKKMVTEVLEVLTNLIMVIISQNISISNHYIVYIKLIQFFVLIISQ